MSDERSVEARLLTLLASSFSSSLIDARPDSSYWSPSDTSEPVVPEHITAALQNTVDLSPNVELRRVARLGLIISVYQVSIWSKSYYAHLKILNRQEMLTLIPLQERHAWLSTILF
jgi:hypothetical protein